MKKHARYLSLLFGLLFAVLAIGGCSREVQTPDIPVSDITGKLLEELEWVDNMRQLEESVIGNFYDFDTSNIESMEIYISDSGSTAEEIAVVKLSDSSAKEDVQAAMEKRVEKQKKQFENYMPEEMYKLENALITSHGNYVLLAVADGFEQADQLFESCFDVK